VPLGPGHATAATRYPAAGKNGTLLVLAHGAGAGQHHPFMTAMAARLSARGISVVTFDFPYVHEGRKVPDRAGVLEACFASVANWAARQEDQAPERLLLGGKSMGGRMATHLAAAGFSVSDGAAPRLAGIVALGYPLHPPGRPQQLRDAHLPKIVVPVLVVQGSRDTFGTPAELTPVVARMAAPVTVHVVEGGDHSFAVARTPRETVLDSVADVVADWASRV
jgi:predicted alpha/beta-hydrolase family hydrolase